MTSCKALDQFLAYCLYSTLYFNRNCWPQISLYSPLLITADQVPETGSWSRLRTISVLSDLLPRAMTGHMLMESTLGGRRLSSPAAFSRVDIQSLMYISLFFPGLPFLGFLISLL